MGIMGPDGAVDLELSRPTIVQRLSEWFETSGVGEGPEQEWTQNQDLVVGTITRSRYINLYRLLHNHLHREESYLGIVRNQILVDVQGKDLLYQIFTCNVLQRQPGEEAPFLEFIQRVCAEEECGAPATERRQEIKPGCGGFGIRNFLTLFLSIEVSKVMAEVAEAKALGDERAQTYAQQMVDCYTAQLDESNPILTEISDAMTKEGICQQELLSTEDKGYWQTRLAEAGAKKSQGNRKLMECSAKYKGLMKTIREMQAQETD
mmetsp:Transcript_20634/g.47668  ORF Transcript_20634/g.47668 Transcript_20634/m.47668 type:complete len:263 (-) Transcript_20634:40-828(-)